jgi:hypothetical protein
MFIETVICGLDDSQCFIPFSCRDGAVKNFDCGAEKKRRKIKKRGQRENYNYFERGSFYI